jgi:hypothetical protein
MTRVGLIRSNWNCNGRIRFGCLSPRLPLMFDAGSSALETQVAP